MGFGAQFSQAAMPVAANDNGTLRFSPEQVEAINEILKPYIEAQFLTLTNHSGTESAISTGLIGSNVLFTLIKRQEKDGPPNYVLQAPPFKIECNSLNFSVVKNALKSMLHKHFPLDTAQVQGHRLGLALVS